MERSTRVKQIDRVTFDPAIGLVFEAEPQDLPEDALSTAQATGVSSAVSAGLTASDPPRVNLPNVAEQPSASVDPTITSPPIESQSKVESSPIDDARPPRVNLSHLSEDLGSVPQLKRAMKSVPRGLSDLNKQVESKTQSHALNPEAPDFQQSVKSGDNEFKTDDVQGPDEFALVYPSINVTIPDSKRTSGIHSSNGPLKLQPAVYGEDHPLLLHPLADWNGRFAPAPESWESRAGIGDSLACSDRIFKWRRGCPEQEPIIVHEIMTAFKEPKTRKLAPEIVPISWKPNRIDGLFADVWWGMHLDEIRLKATEIEARPAIDMSSGQEVEVFEKDIIEAHAKPWWKTYANIDASMLYLPRKLASPVDRNDPLSMRRLQFTTNRTIEIFNEGSRVYGHKIGYLKQMERDIEEHAAIGHELTGSEITSTAPHSLKPVADGAEAKAVKLPLVEAMFWCRPAGPTDAYDMEVTRTAAIDTLEILDTLCQPSVSFDEKITAHTRRLQEANDQQLPFLVAGQKGQLNATGYAYAVNAGPSDSFLSLSVDLHVVVPPGNKELYTVLLDKLISICDNFHLADNPIRYEFLSDSLYYMPGGRRTLRNLRMAVYYTSEADLEWKMKVAQDMSFELKGVFPGIGRKKVPAPPPSWASHMFVDIGEAIFWKQTKRALPD